MMRAKFYILFIAMALFAFCSCSSDDPDNGRNNESTATPTNITPTLNWGENSQEIKLSQNNSLQLSVENDTLLRYVDYNKNSTIDYKFKDDKLVAASLTQPNILSTNDIVKHWLKGYSKISESDNTVFYIAQAKKTIALGRIIQGSDAQYASVAWTYIDENEDITTNGPDFSPSGAVNGYEYVDLGLGIGWCVQNLGASSPTEVGNYYMWGETVARSSCWWWYYSLYTGDTSTYLDDRKFYTPYSDITGTKYDAVKAKMGEKWRMPSRAEAMALINNCQISVGDYNGVSGFIITGPSGKSIFIPKNGRKKKEEISSAIGANLWTSTNSSSGDSYIIAIRADASAEVNTAPCFYGYPMRGVIDLQ